MKIGNLGSQKEVLGGLAVTILARPCETLVSREVLSRKVGLARSLVFALANYVDDMSPTCCQHFTDIAKSWPTLRVVATQKRPRHTQFISITTDKYKSAQTYRYLSYDTFFVFELKGVANMQRHPANTTFSCVCIMTSDVSRHVAGTTHADIRHSWLRFSQKKP
jgi:hypothetical protein